MGYGGGLVHYGFQGVLLFGVDAEVLRHLANHGLFVVGVSAIGPRKADEVGNQGEAQVAAFKYVEVLLNALVAGILGGGQHLLGSSTR